MSDNLPSLVRDLHVVCAVTHPAHPHGMEVVTLIGAVPSSREAPTWNDCRRTWIGLREIADLIVERVPESVFRCVRPFDRSIHLARERGFRADVELDIELVPGKSWSAQELSPVLRQLGIETVR